jgi:hypothetical protein
MKRTTLLQGTSHASLTPDLFADAAFGGLPARPSRITAGGCDQLGGAPRERRPPDRGSLAEGARWQAFRQSARANLNGRFR